MPSPRSGTVTPDVGKVVREYKAGKVEFRNDAGGNVHAVVGKMSFDPAKLQENIQAFIDHILAMKPNCGQRNVCARAIAICATMSPARARGGLARLRPSRQGLRGDHDRNSEN